MRNGARNSLTRLGWWTLALVCVFYGTFAFYMAGLEILFLLGMAEEAPFRAVPLVFVVHALSGGIALISTPLQFNARLRGRVRAAHRVVGRVYVGAIFVSSITAFLLAISFDVNLAARIALGVLSLLWCSTTMIALLLILERDIARHREWMVRSLSLTLFFVTFSVWVPGLASTTLPESIGYPLAVFLSWSLNLLGAEMWIRHARADRRAHLLDRSERRLQLEVSV